MRRVLSSVGIGAASVDGVVPTPRLAPGEVVDVSVEVEGGSSRQRVEGIDLALVARYDTGDGHETATIKRFDHRESFTVEPDEERKVPVTVELPRSTPLSMGDVTVWLATTLDIRWAVDPRSKTELDVVPDDQRRAVFDAVDGLGFTFEGSTCWQSERLQGQPFAQSFTFHPHSSSYRSRLDELVLVCLPRGGEMEVHVEVDVREELLAEKKERRNSIRVTDPNVEHVRHDLRAAIERAT